MFTNFFFFQMTYFDKFLMQGLSKYYKEIIIIFKDFFKRLFQKYFKNSLGILFQK
jgi:hypothetical protein